jgi:hypothetical protein
MTARLSPEIREALQAQGQAPLELVDPATNERYVLLSHDQYERIKWIVTEEPLSQADQQWLLGEAGRRAAWDDPAMDAYDRYDEERAKQP